MCVICTWVFLISEIQCGRIATSIGFGWGFGTADCSSFSRQMSYLKGSEKRIQTENLLSWSQLQAIHTLKPPEMFAQAKRAKQKIHKRTRSCCSNTDQTKKIWAATINYHHQTFSNCLAKHLKNSIKKCWLSYFFSVPLSLNLSLSFFSLIHLSRHAENTKCVTRTGPSLPFSPRPHRLGSRPETELPLAQPRAPPPCRMQSRRLPAPQNSPEPFLNNLKEARTKQQRRDARASCCQKLACSRMHLK